MIWDNHNDIDQYCRLQITQNNNQNCTYEQNPEIFWERLPTLILSFDKERN